MTIAIAVAAVFASAPALGNGRFPASGQVIVDPTDADHLVLRATFGILRSKDRGAHWGWICESAVGYGGTQDPMMAMTTGGTLLAGVFEGLLLSHDDGCSWSHGAGPGTVVVDLSVRAANPSDVVLLALDLTGSSVAQLLRSSDAGETFTPLAALPNGVVALTVDVAPSEPTTLYVSGRFGAPDYPGTLLRSDDGGTHWQRFDVPQALGRSAYIAAVAPADPATVYVRLDGAPGDELVVTHDGGQSWSSLFQSKGDLLTFALAPDGSQLVVGGESDGLWRSPTNASAFMQVSMLTTRCATWTPNGLYVCADEIADGFSLGFSPDAGTTISAVMHLASTCGPLDCAMATCGTQWAAMAQRLGNPSCGTDAGSGGMPPAPPTPPPASGCACRTADRTDQHRPGTLATTLLLAAVAGRWFGARRRASKASASATVPRT